MFTRELNLNWDERAPLLLRPRIRAEKAPLALAHLTAQEYVTGHYLNKHLMDTYFKFTTVRDPMARLRSAYAYLGASFVMSFEDFVRQEAIPAAQDAAHQFHWFLRPQSDFFVVDGKTIADRVIRLEHLAEEMGEIAELLGFKSSEVPHENRSPTKSLLGRVRATGGGALRFRTPPRYRRAGRNNDLKVSTLKTAIEVYASDYTHLPYSAPGDSV